MSSNSFYNFFNKVVINDDEKHLKNNINENSVKKDKNMLQLIRSSGVKIKLLTPTKFGIQIDVFKESDIDIIVEILNSLNIKESDFKIKGPSIFIANS